MRLSILLALIPLATSSPSYAARHNEDSGLFYAAVASQDITPPVGVPLAGHGAAVRRALIPFSCFFHKYATYFKPSKGILDPIRAKVVLLKRGDKRLLFLSLDLVAVTDDFHTEVANAVANLGFTPEEVFVSGTHTHNGPGAISKNPLWAFVAVDRFKPAIYDPILASVVHLIHRAYAELEPAVLQAYQFRVEGLQVNRRDDHPASVVDPSANVLVVSNSMGEYLGALINVAVHGTALPKANLLLSTDVPGALEHAFEARLAAHNDRSSRVPTAVFINGAEGDVAPAQEGQPALQALGTLFATQADAALSAARLIWPSWEIRRATVDLGTAKVRLKNCVNGAFMRALVWGKLAINVAQYVRRQTTIATIKLGDMMMMTWPGEPTTALGFALKELAYQAGARQAWVLGLTNDYLAYFVTPDEYNDGGYESCACVFGAHGGKKIVEGYRLLLNPCMSAGVPMVREGQ